MKTLSITLILLVVCNVWADDKVIHIYQDADLSRHTESSKAIQKGIELAFAEVDNTLLGYKIKFKYLDHRGNVVRSKRNYKTFLADPSALVIYSGIHSPPLIKNRAFINQSEALTLVPWAAGGPITRYPSAKNWVFRLSVDDTQAGSVIIDYAINQQKCQAPHLLLEATPWGESNLKSMTKALTQYSELPPAVTRFSWNLKHRGAQLLLNEVHESGSDCIVLVANAVEGVVIVKALLAQPESKQMPVVSHWGITGGNFADVIDAEQRRKLSLHFIQTCFAFTNLTLSSEATSVFERLKQHTNGKVSQVNELKSAVGFIHAYDLTKVLIAAIQQAGLSGNIEQDRNNIRLALENLKAPVQGLVKTYQKPFSAFSESNVNAHEALNKEHYCMGRFGEQGEILISHE